MNERYIEAAIQFEPRLGASACRPCMRRLWYLGYTEGCFI